MFPSIFLLLQLTEDWWSDNMAAVTNKRKILDIEEKVKLTQEIENDVKNADVCQEFGLINSTMKMIWKSRIKIISAFEQNRLRIKSSWKPECCDVNEVLHKWFWQQRSDSVPVSSLLMINFVLCKC